MEKEYKLANGQVITDESAADIMRRLVELKPYKNYLYQWDDIGTATLVSDIYNSSIRYCPQIDRWFIRERHTWKKQIDNGVISDMLQTVLNLLVIYCTEAQAKFPDDKGVIEKYSKYIKQIRNYSKMRGIIEVMKSMVRFPLYAFDTSPYILNTPRAAYDLRTGKETKDVAAHNITKTTTCSLPTKVQKPCKRWGEFIDEIMSGDKEKAAFLQRALGYSLLGANKEECMFIAYGSKTRNGKGTLFSTINAVLGEDYADGAPVDLICESKAGKTTDFNAPQPALAKLVGVRLVSLSEASRDVRLDAAAVKSITGRDTLVTRALFQNSFSFVPQFTMWLNTNYLPAVTDDTVFSSNRVWVIEFNEHFDENSRDKDLKELFADEANKPTILKWLMDGCADYMAQGLNPPECVKEATDNYRRVYDRIGGFVDEMCNKEGKIKRSDLYAAYTKWCLRGENRYKAMSTTKFYAELAVRGYPVKRNADYYYIDGISLKTDTEVEL